MRKINVGVSVAPPNVVHTAPFVAKELGFFQKRCLDVNIIQFDGGAAGTSVTSVAQGSSLGNLPDLAIARGLRGRQVWGLAPRMPQGYMVTEAIKTPADLKGKRLSAAGGVGGFNWLMGREMLRRANLTEDDATFISQGTAGRLPGLLTGQLDAVFLHPEDVYLAQKQKPGLHVLAYLSDILPQQMFNAYGAQEAWLQRDRELIRDTIASMIEANRAAYTDRAKVLPVIVKATEKPKEAVEYSLDVLTKNCVLSVNEGIERARTEWTMQRNVDIGDLKPEQKLSFEQIADYKLAQEAVAAAGGRVKLGNCEL
jgi:ABC-type nitrate/sulfonate/bicarbonate transport system substrate-binding protein